MNPTPKRLSTLELKGSALSILWCILDYKIVRGVDVVGTKQLVRETGYSRPSLSDGLDRLTANGYLVAYETRGQGGETIYGLSKDFPSLFQGAERLADAPNAPTLQKIFAALDVVVVKELTDLKELNQLTQQQPTATLQKIFAALPETETREQISSANQDPIAARLLALGGSEKKISVALARRRAHETADATIGERIDHWLEYIEATDFEPVNTGAFITAAIGDWRGIPGYTRRIPAPVADEETPVVAEVAAELAASARAEQERLAWVAARAAEKASDQANPAYPVLRQLQARFAHQGGCAERMKGLRPSGLTPAALTLLCPATDIAWLSDRMLGQLRREAASILGHPVNVVLLEIVEA